MGQRKGLSGKLRKARSRVGLPGSLSIEAPVDDAFALDAEGEEDTVDDPTLGGDIQEWEANFGTVEPPADPSRRRR